MPTHRKRALFIRAWRLLLLLTAVFILRQAAQEKILVETTAALHPAKLKDFFADAASLGDPVSGTGRRPVLDGAGKILGYVATTSPEGDKIIGYSGPTVTLLAFAPQGMLTGLRVLKSHDTSDHLAEVIADRGFFNQFKGLKSGEVPKQPLHTVTGATLTSAAIAQGILTKLGQTAQTSLRFPEEITLAEVKAMLPEAATVTQHPGFADRLEVKDVSGKVIAQALRTSPVTDSLIGYKGPTDTLMLLDAGGQTLKKIALRKSYDTKRYVAYVTGDEYFLNLFNGRSVEALAGMDFDKEKIEGVSGATETSWSMAEGLKRKAQQMLEQRPAAWVQQLSWRWQDTGHAVILLSAFVMAFTRLRGKAWLRHLHHALLVLYGGFWVAELLSQGLLAGWAAHGTPWRSSPGLLLVAAVALLGPVFTGKQLYCHHICPHGALQQLVARRLSWQWRIPAWLDKALYRLPFLLLAFVFIAACRGLAVDLNDLEPFDAYVFQVAGTASIAIAIAGLLAALFTPLAYCKYGCPTGALFKLLRFTGDSDRLGTRDWLAAALLAAALLL